MAFIILSTAKTPVLISKCKDLKELNINDCNFTNDCIDSICSLLGLKFLNVSRTHILEEQLIKLIRNLIKLEKLKINECDDIDFECLENINSIKLERGDSHILKIYYNYDSYLSNDVYEGNVNLENLSLLSLRVQEN